MIDTNPVARTRGRAHRLLRRGLAALTASVVAGLWAVRTAFHANDRYLFSGEGIEYLRLAAAIGVTALLLIVGLALVLANRRTAQAGRNMAIVGSMLALTAIIGAVVAAGIAADRTHCPADKPACQQYYEARRVLRVP